ncbi:MAG TPA: TetR/AcrR family transcriptional regulator [Solirubrobacterales bacterium]|nr:TetR/AcrR family transcriptional regulator [Solirubrobacterales bacterium]
MARKYEMKRRAERVRETRRRIVEAAIDLHARVGPANTTVSAIAERAGVERQTFYRHFPDERSINMACSGLYMERNPLPNADEWRAIEDPRERLRHGLAELYGYYEANEAMFSNVIRDAEFHAITLEMATGHMAAIAELHAALAEGLARDGERRRMDAALQLALGFHTWRSLVRYSGLSTHEAVELSAASVLAVIGSEGSRLRST